MHRWISELMDEYVFELVKLAYRGYRKRMPAYRPAGECDMAVLGAIGAPDPVDLTPEPDWQGYRCESFRFTSPVDCGCPENRTVAGRLITAAPDGPWTLIIPGYSTGALPPHGYGFFQDGQGLACLKRSINVALIDLPYHLSRCRSGRGSGEGFFSPDLADMQATFRQGAADCIALVRYLQRRFGRPVGVWGTSLGGNMAAHVTAHVPDLAAAVLMEPLDNPGHSIQLLRSSREIRDVLARHEIAAELAPAQLTAVAPSTHQPKVDPARILFVSGRWDRIIPFDLQEALWEAWGRPARIVLDAGHLTMPNNQAMNGQVLDFLTHCLTQP